MRTRFLLFLFVIPVLFAQGVVLSVGSGSGAKGSAVTVPITLTSSGGAQPAGLQWSFSYPAGITGVTVVVGTSATNAQKLVTCTGITCIIYGVNTNYIADGVAASATFQLAAGASGTIPISLTSVVAASLAADSIPASGGSGNIVVSAAPAALSTVGCLTSSITAPSSASCTVTLSAAAPAGGFQVSLSSSNANLSVPTSVTVAAGQTTATFAATAAAVSTDQNGVTITASAGGVTKTASVNLLAPAQLQSLSCSPGTIGSNATSTCTVTLIRTAASPVGVTLSSNNTLLAVPGSVTIATGQVSSTFSASSGVVTQNQSAIATATVNGTTQSFTLNLTTSIQLSLLSCSPTVFGSPGSSTCTITLSGPAPPNTTAIVSSDNAKVTVPGVVTFNTGQSSATFTATVAPPTANQTVTLTVNLNGISLKTSITLMVPSLSTLFCSPLTLNSNQSANCTLFLDRVTTTPTSVGLASNRPALQIPASVTVPLGSNTATFSVTTANLTSNDQATVTATLNDQTRTATISLAASFQISTLTCAPTSVMSNGSTLCTVNLSQPAANAVAVAISSSLNALTVPSSVTIPSGQSVAIFSAIAGTITTASIANISVTLNGQTLTSQVHLSTPGQLSAISCSRGVLLSSGATTCTVTLASPALNTMTPSVTVSSPAITAPSSITIAAGATTATFSISASDVPMAANAFPSRQLVTLTASLSNSSVATSIRVGSVAATVSGVFNATGNPPGRTCSARALATVAGSGFTSQPQQTAGELPWPAQLAGVQVKIDDQPAPLLSVSDNSIQFQCPASAAGRELRLVVEPESGQPTDAVSIVMEEATPSLFELNAAHQGDVLIAGTDRIASADSIDRPGRPAKRGESISIYADGLGPLSESLPSGAPAPLDRLIRGLAPITVVMGDSGLALSPTFAGLSPGIVGVFVVNVLLTDDVPTGASVPLYLNVTLSDGTILSTNTVRIAVANADVQ